MTALERLVQAAERLFHETWMERDLGLYAIKNNLSDAKSELAALQAAGITRPECLKKLFDTIDTSQNDTGYVGSTIEFITNTKSNHLTLVWKAASQCRDEGGE